jgi:hypothetical protein
MTADLLSTISGALLSLGFSYLPGASDWFSRLDGTRKRLLMLALLFLSSLAIFGLACAGWAGDLGLALTCNQAGILGLLRAFLLAVMANQSAYALSPQSNRARERQAA